MKYQQPTAAPSQRVHVPYGPNADKTLSFRVEGRHSGTTLASWYVATKEQYVRYFEVWLERQPTDAEMAELTKALADNGILTKQMDHVAKVQNQVPSKYVYFDPATELGMLWRRKLWPQIKQFMKKNPSPVALVDFCGEIIFQYRNESFYDTLISAVKLTMVKARVVNNLTDIVECRNCHKLTVHRPESTFYHRLDNLLTIHHGECMIEWANKFDNGGRVIPVNRNGSIIGYMVEENARNVYDPDSEEMVYVLPVYLARRECYEQGGRYYSREPGTTQHLLRYSEDVLKHHEMKHTVDSKKTGLLLGVELEVESVAGRAAAINTLIDKKQPLICKSDGSLDSERGFEIVTAPAGIEYQQNMWSVLLTSGWQEKITVSDKCGLHVHVSRPKSKHTIARIIAFANRGAIDKQWETIWITVARRGSNRFARTVGDNAKMRGAAKLTMMDASNFDRYNTVNLKKLPTVEFRMFASSNDPVQVLTAVEMAHAIVSYSKNAIGLRDNVGMSAGAFLNWLARRDNRALYPNLHITLKSLYSEKGMVPIYKLPNPKATNDKDHHLAKVRAEAERVAKMMEAYAKITENPERLVFGPPPSGTPVVDHGWLYTQDEFGNQVFQRIYTDTVYYDEPFVRVVDGGEHFTGEGQKVHVYNNTTLPKKFKGNVWVAQNGTFDADMVTHARVHVVEAIERMTHYSFKTNSLMLEVGIEDRYGEYVTRELPIDALLAVMGSYIKTKEFDTNAPRYETLRLMDTNMQTGVRLLRACGVNLGHVFTGQAKASDNVASMKIDTATLKKVRKIAMDRARRAAKRQVA